MDNINKNKSWWKVAFITALVVFIIGVSFDSFAKRGGSRSFSKSSSSFSFSSRSSSVSKPSVKKSSYSSYSSKKTISTTHTKQPQKVQKVQSVKTAKTVRSQGGTSSFSGSVQKKQKVATSKSAYKQQQQMFKPRPKTATASTGTSRTTGTTTTTTHKKYTVQSSPVIYKTRNVNRTTYVQRRGRYYDSWDTPTYVYSGYSSYGMWDAMALWFMLDHINDAQYRNMYYHQMNTPGMVAWRKEAEQLAEDNAELRSKLRAMDQGAQTMASQGVRRDESYIPEGVDADILLSSEVLEDTKPTIRMCTGTREKNYYNVAKILGRNLDSVKIEPIVTAGSADNLEKMESGACDAAIVQRDAYWNHVDSNPASTLDFERIMSPYSEVVHMVCNRDSGVDSLSDLNSSHTVLIGEKGSGSQVTWQNIVAEDDDYTDVRTQNVGGALAKTRVTSGQADCLLSVSGMHTQFMTNVNDLGRTTNLDLVEFDDNDILDVTDPAGKPVYETFELPADTYSNLQKDNWTGRVSVDTDTIIVPADIIVNNSWTKQNKQTFELFVAESINRVSVIQRYAGGQ